MFPLPVRVPQTFLWRSKSPTLTYMHTDRESATTTKTGGDSSVEGVAGDWNCPKCKTLVFGSKEACFQCGYAKRNDWACPTCQSLVFASKTVCFKCGTAGGGGGVDGPPRRGGGGRVKMGGRAGRRGIVDVSVGFVSKQTRDPFRSRGAVGFGGLGLRRHPFGLQGLCISRCRGGVGVGVTVNSGEAVEGGGVDGWDPTNKEWNRVG